MNLSFICMQLVVTIVGAQNTDGGFPESSLGLNTLDTKNFFKKWRKDWSDDWSDFKKRNPADEFIKLQDNRILVVSCS